MIDLLKAEICWVLSNLKQDKINVALLVAEKTNLYQTLSELLHMSNMTTRYEVIYLVSFYLKGLEFEQLHQLLFKHNLLSLLVSSLFFDDPKGLMLNLSIHTIKGIFKRAHKHYKTPYNHDISVAFENMLGLDQVEKLLYHPNNSVYKKSLKFLELYFEKIDPCISQALTAHY